MKRTLLFGLSLITGAMSYAQITINASDIIGFGEYVELTYDTIPTITHTPAGPNQTWNYTSLNSHTTENFGFGSPNWYPGGADFPTATLAAYDASTDAAAFFLKTVDAMDILGVHGDFAETGTSQSLVFDPFDRVITFPSTYQTEYFNTFNLDFTLDGSGFSIDSVVIASTSDKTSIFDAWGTITTPFGTFEVVRQSVYEATTSEVNGYLFGASIFNETDVEEVYKYTFWTNDTDSRYAVFEYTYNPGADVVEEVTWQSASPVLSLEEASNDISGVTVFPNPAVESLTLEMEQAGDYEVEIVDGLGRLAHKTTVSGNINTISVEDLTNGIYTVRIMDTNTRQTSVKRIAVQH